MEEHNLLGIYISSNNAAAAYIDSHTKVLDFFEISTEEIQNEEENPAPDEKFAQIAKSVSKECSKRQISTSRISIGVDCSMYTQHNVRSEFTDQKQIASTVRFDTEEAIATDIGDYAIAFSKKISDDKSGSDLKVFTIKKEPLGGIIKAFQKENMDPVTIQPDVMLVSEFIKEKIITKSGKAHQNLFITISDTKAYFIIYDENSQEQVTRTILLAENSDYTDQLGCQILLTTARLSGQVNSVKILGSEIDTDALSEKIGMDVENIHLKELVDEQASERLDKTENKAGYIISFGTAIAGLEKRYNVNFRDDYMPYQGRKRKIQQLTRTLSIALTGIIVIFGAYLSFDLMQKKSIVSRQHEKFAKDYSVVMMGESMPDSAEKASKELARELRRIRSVKSGQLSMTGEKSVSSKLTLLLKAFNKSAKATNLEIDSISITSRSINVIGSTSSRANTLKLMESLKGTQLEITKSRLDIKDSRDHFSITLDV